MFNMTVKTAKNKVVVLVEFNNLTFDRYFKSSITKSYMQLSLRHSFENGETLFEYILITVFNILAKYDLRQTCSTRRALQLCFYQKLSINYNLKGISNVLLY